MALREMVPILTLIIVMAMLAFTVIAVFAVAAWHQFRIRSQAKIETTATALDAILARVNEFLTRNSYARESHRHPLAEAASRALEMTHAVSWRYFATVAQKKTAVEVSYFATQSKSIVAQVNATFIKSELTAFSKFFDAVESKPLTPAQRRSCVSGEDNNLVLAGAGTGKTSTMIGRAGYLLASKRVRPDQLLMLAYAKKAAGEMQERLDSRLNPWLTNGTPTIKTFHALGLEIIGAVEGHRPDLTPMAEDKHRFAKFIDTEITRHCDVPEYRTMIVRYCGYERFSYHNPFDFKSMPEYKEYVRANELRTLKREVVKSFEECVIANFLDANSVSYVYEAPYKIDTSGPDFRQYKPDFFLPDYDVYIEHFALDRDGNPPSYLDQRKYLEGITWKRKLHLKHGTKLIETYSHLKRAGLLESTLAKLLQDAGVELHPKSEQELLEELRNSSEISEFSELLSGFLDLFKQSDHRLDTLRNAAARHRDAKRLLLLLDLFTPILNAYEAELASCKQIDFADMIRKATEHVESGHYKSPYTHLLVDEFQDISKARARLVSALVKQRPESVLFVVGDDWQSIYRFTGSDIAYTRDFPHHFGATATIPLETTFRFNDQISDAASKFVLKNPSQIVKTIRSVVTVQQPAISPIRVLAVEDGLNLALEAISKRTAHVGERKTTVLVLGRYNFTVGEWCTPTAKRRMVSQYPALDIACMTVHAAKGKEADFVVVLGLSKGKLGFPSERPTDSVLEFLLPSQEQFPLAEERRLFYVALTRARHRVYLVYNPMEASPFVLELLNGGYPICTDEFDPGVLCADIAHVSCPKCGTGALVPRTSEHGPFFACNNFPYCTHTEKPCPLCGGLMRRNGGKRECTNPTCKAVVPICSACGGSMVERNGPYGKFWGCINYRSNAEFFCTHTINISNSGRPSAAYNRPMSRGPGR